MPIFPPRDAHASSPWQASAAEWWSVLRATWTESSADNVGLIAAGVAYYALLAFVPLIAATVLTVGIVADSAWLVEQMGKFSANLPENAAALVREQVANVVTTSDSKKGLGLLAALAVALFGARNGAGAILTALNIAMEVPETRSFLRLNLLALVVTLGAMAVGIATLAALAVIAAFETIPFLASGVMLVAGRLLSLLLLAGIASAGAATLYRYGPNRPEADWIWVTPGSAFFAFAWIALTYGLGIYVANFGDYDVTYGSIGAVVVLITWFYLSAYVFTLGGELNSEFERLANAKREARAPRVIAASAKVGPEAPAERPGIVRRALWFAAAAVIVALSPSR